METSSGEVEMSEEGVGKETGLAYGFKRWIPVGMEEALTRTRAALQGEGFGVLFELNLEEKLREKLGVEFRPYVILGACHPPIAYQALQMEEALGLLLPCNVIVYGAEGGSVVAAIDAAKMMSVVGNPKLEEAATEVNARLQRVIEKL